MPKLKSIDKIQFQNSLLNWFKKNKRSLPWREQAHWYPVFLSEIMLQQTQVDQALPYYVKFIKRYPNIHALSKATEQEVLSLWAGLGYYSRARNLLKTARIIVTDYQAKFPRDIKQALMLPGIGKYSASAILSIVYNLPYAVVDGNVYRVMSRLFAVPDDIRLNKTQKSIQKISDQLLSNIDPGNYNEAIMELGAVICKKQNPDCIKCPVQTFCEAFKKNEQLRYPIKSAAPSKRKITHHALIIVNKEAYLFVQRPASGLLASFWEFPILEMKKKDIKDELLESELKKIYGIEGKVTLKGDVFRHQYSHIDLTYQPVIILSLIHI